MKPKDLKLAEESMDAFVGASISRFKENGEMIHAYKLSDEDIKVATGRERIKDETRQEYIQYFTDAGVYAQYNETLRMLVIGVNLENLQLKGSQARALVNAMEQRKHETRSEPKVRRRT